MKKEKNQLAFEIFFNELTRFFKTLPSSMYNIN